MTKKWDFFVGMDVSKKTIDVSCNNKKIHIKIDNNWQGFSVLLKWFSTNQIDVSQTLVVFEYTGGYEFRLMQFCESKNIDYCRLPGLEIKKSIGMVRGKNDKVDAKRISQYAYEKRESIKPSTPINTIVAELKNLMNYRKKLVRENAGYKSSISERKAMYDVKKKDLIITSLTKKLNNNEKLIKEIEAAIEIIINKDDALLLNYNLLTSIKGIGSVNAIMTIVITENFTKFSNARKYAVYCGVVPFDNSSGSRINGRKKVSHLANKDVKQELNQAAKAAMMYDEETKLYGERKLSLGKHYKVVFNNIKFKLILRMFAVVNNKKMYMDKYKKIA
ncbi:MAG: IS110 family transposase [Chitinophagaceae bacterium]